MKSQSPNARPAWLVLLPALGVGLGLSLLALIPLFFMTGSGVKRRGSSPVVSESAPQAPPVLIAQSAQLARASSPAAKRSAAQASLPDGEINSYQSEMRLLQEKARINQDTAKQMSDMGAPERGVDLLNEAVQMTQVSACLKNQMDRGVPFYDGKAKCAAAVPAGS